MGADLRVESWGKVCLRAAALGGLSLAAALTAVRPAGATPYGVNAHIPSAAELDLVVGAGMEWVRIDVLWSQIEPQPDIFDWSVYDRLIADAQARGLRVMGTISDTPAWATSGEPGRGVPQAADWYDVCYRLASRYRGRVAAWGLWNEPNMPRFWLGSRRDYIDVILKAGSAALRAGDPKALVCAPDLAHLHSANWDSWLEDVLDEAADDIDVVTHHIYPDGPDAGAVVKALMRDGQPWEDPSVRTVLRRAGWIDRPFWLTETGFDSASLSGSGESAQLLFVTNLLHKMFGPGRELAWVERLFLYELCDDPRYPDRSWGLAGAPPGYRIKPPYRGVVAFAGSAVDDAEIVAVTMPRRVTPGATWEATVTVRNAGTTTWTAADGYALGSPDDADPFAFHRVYLDGDAAVTPGGEITFAIAMHAPTGIGADGESLSSDWQMVREGTWWFGAVARREIVVSPQPEARSLVLGAAAHTDGLNGTRWRTDLLLHNAGGATARAEVAMLAEGGGSDRPRSVAVTLEAGATLRFDDVLRTVFGTSGNAALRVELDRRDVTAAARTYTPHGFGSCGQYVPAIAADAAVTAGETAALLGLTHSPDRSRGFRTNLGLVNPSTEPAEAEIAYFAGAGPPLAVQTVTVPASGFIQRTDVFRDLTSSPTVEGRIEVRPLTTGARLLPYASLVDNVSGDPTMVLPAIATDEPQLLIGVAHNRGLYSTVWRSDVTLRNPTSNSTRVELVLRAGSSAPRDAALDLAPGGEFRIPDVVASLFGAEGAGTIELLTHGGAVAAVGRTFNATPDGTFGEGLIAVPISRAAAFGDEIRLPSLERDAGATSGFRTNVALVNVGERPAKLGVLLFAAGSSYLGTLEVELGPHEWRQLTDVFARIGAATVHNGLAVVRARTGDARFLAYAAVVDNVTGDPIVVPGW